MTLDADEFVRRFLIHVLPNGFHRIRHNLKYAAPFRGRVIPNPMLNPAPKIAWFFDKEKTSGPRSDQVLFIDARRVFRQIDRAHRDFTPAQIEFLSNIVRLWRGTEIFLADGSATEIKAHFPDYRYRDVAGLCRRATRKEIEARRWSLSPGRYVGVAPGQTDDSDFRERLEELQEELEQLNAEAASLQARIAQNVAELIA